jgi:hypothetical protein
MLMGLCMEYTAIGALIQRNRNDKKGMGWYLMGGALGITQTIIRYH